MSINLLSEEVLEYLARADPILATSIGINDYNHLLPDYSPERYEQSYEKFRTYRSQLQAQPLVTSSDAASKDVLLEFLNNAIAIHDIGGDYGFTSVLAGPLPEIIDQFDLFDFSDKDQARSALARLEAIPTALEQYGHSLRYRSDKGLYPLRTLQLELLLQAIPTHISILSTTFAGAAALQPALKAYEQLTGVIKDLLPRAIDDNAVGADIYRVVSRSFLGASINLPDMYEWGQELLASIITEQKAIAQETTGSDNIDLACEQFNHDPKHTVHSKAELVSWMQKTANDSITLLNGRYFDIPTELHAIDCRIAPAGTGCIYYTAPSEDLTRPGTMWWSVPPGVDSWHTWQEKTTVYHEGLPGHHLQLGLAMINPELNRFRKLCSFISGHGEGWALYAERLMDELGFLTTPADRMGMLHAQKLRAVRVVLDIGYHCRFPAPQQLGGGEWTYDKAWQFMRANLSSTNEKTLRFELHRYLGWPGQAPSYAIGQKMWENTRDTYLTNQPNRLSQPNQSALKEFHTRALALGGIGLEALQKHLLTERR